MTEPKSFWESIKVDGLGVIDTLKDLVREGNVRRVIVEQDGRTVAEFPLTLGLVGAVFAPMFAAIAAILALARDCTIHVERVARDATTDATTDATSSATTDDATTTDTTDGSAAGSAPPGAKDVA